MTSRQGRGPCRTGFSSSSRVRKVCRRGQGCGGLRSRGLERAGEGQLLQARVDPCLLSIVPSTPLCLTLSIWLLAVPHSFAFLFLSGLQSSVSQCPCEYLPRPLYLQLSLSVCPSLGVSPSPCCVCLPTHLLVTYCFILLVPSPAHWSISTTGLRFATCLLTGIFQAPRNMLGMW